MWGETTEVDDSDREARRKPFCQALWGFRNRPDGDVRYRWIGG